MSFGRDVQPSDFNRAPRCRRAPKSQERARSGSGWPSPPAGGASPISRSLGGRRTGLSRPADRDAIHAQGRLADADGHALAILAAGADAGIELEIVADHANAVEVGWAVADQHGPLERLAQLAVLDLVGLGDLEHVFARGNVDLTPAEIDGIDAVLDRGHDLAR